MRLSKRLETIANMVSINSKVADIGTDHGQVPIFLCENKISNYVVCSDISEMSLMKSKEEVARFNQIHPRLGDGLNVIEIGEVDEVIIAGMGGHLIVKILEENLEIVKNLKGIILQPMQASDYLRQYLYTKYNFIDEKIVYEDDRYFELIKVKFSNEYHKIDEIFYTIPKITVDRKDEEALNFIKHLIKTKKEIIYKISNSEKGQNKKAILFKQIKKLEELLWDINQEK